MKKEIGWLDYIITIIPIPRDPGSPCQMMIGVYNHLRNARCLGSIAIRDRIHVWYICLLDDEGSNFMI